eukprot:scaffold310_cov168-Amphora_coffeaeformis.AAC.7
MHGAKVTCMLYGRQTRNEKKGSMDLSILILWQCIGNPVQDERHIHGMAGQRLGNLSRLFTRVGDTTTRDQP